MALHRASKCVMIIKLAIEQDGAASKFGWSHGEILQSGPRAHCWDCVTVIYRILSLKQNGQCKHALPTFLKALSSLGL